MSTLASLMSLLGQNDIQPYNAQELTANRIQSGNITNQTALLQLAEQQRQQEAAAVQRQFIQQHPELLFGGGGGSVLGSLQQPGGGVAPGGGPPGALTQSPLPGMPGQAQTVPAYPDRSRYAEVSPQGGGPIPPDVAAQVMPTVTPPGGPQSTIASLGPQPQQPSPQDRLLALARVNPDAALLIQQRMQAQQDRQWKLQEQQLDMGVKVSEAVARQLQGVVDQASLDEARERIRLIHPQAAAQMPQFYSKEAVESLQQRGIAVKDMAEWKLNMAKAKKVATETRLLPELFKETGSQPPAAADTTTTATSATPRPAQATASTSPEFETAIVEANRLYPQVSITRIKSIIAAESNFDPKAVSSAGAKGPMQLMDATAKDMGVDDPFDVTQNVRGGTRYYAQLLTKYGGDERKALTAYNWGPKNLDDVGGDVTKAPAETQAYVAKVLGGGAGPSGEPRTTQPPPTNPRVAQLDAMIADGTRKAKQAAVLGYESLATQYNNDVQRLQHERDRLDAPRQEYEKKLAVQGLELQQQREQGLAAAQVKADTEPASKEEIDAINRALPPDKRIPYSTTRKTIRERGLVGSEPLAPKILEDLTTTTTAIQNFEELSKAVTALPTGPLTQYVESFKERWGIDISDEKVAQRAILAGARNQLLQARSGAAISPSEYNRLMDELPNESNDPKVFKARLANTVRQFKNLYKTKVQILRKTGHAIPDDLMEPLPSPEGPPAPTVISNVDKFKAIKP